MIKYKTVLHLPEFDTGQFNGAKFIHNGDAILNIDIIEFGNYKITFKKCRYIKFTALYNCDSEMVKSYFKVDEIEDSKELLNYVSGDRATQRAYKTLFHYKIFLDETGCYEIYSESVIGILE